VIATLDLDDCRDSETSDSSLVIDASHGLAFPFRDGKGQFAIYFKASYWFIITIENSED